MAQQQQLDEDEIRSLLPALWTRAVLVSMAFPAVFDGCSAEDAVQDVLLAYQQGDLPFDPERGTLENYLCLVLKRRLLDRLLRSKRMRTLDDPTRPILSSCGGKRPSRSTDTRQARIVLSLRELASEDPEVAVLLRAVEQIDDNQLGNADQAIASAANRTVEWVRNTKRRVKRTFANRYRAIATA